MKKRPPIAFDLKAAIEAKSMTQGQAAELLCTSQPSISTWCQTGEVPELVIKYWNLYWKTKETPVRRTKVA